MCLAGETQPRASQEAAVTEAEYDPFLSRMSLLALYTNGKNAQRQRRSSMFLTSSFGSYLKTMSTSALETPPDCPGIETDGLRVENPLLDEAIDHVVFKRWEPIPGRGRQVETLPHMLGILRCVSLRTLHAGTGWRTDAAQMARLKMQFRQFLERDGARARKGMWHAACIFKSVQSTQRFACYDVFNFGMATCYMVLYVELLQRTPSSAGPPRRIVRLDQLSGREDVQHWIQSGGDADVHLTNVGILDGPDALPRLLRATEKALVGQIAWSAYSRAWARCMVQLRRGEKPTVRTEDYNEADEKESDR